MPILNTKDLLLLRPVWNLLLKTTKQILTAEGTKLKYLTMSLIFWLMTTLIYQEIQSIKM